MGPGLSAHQPRRRWAPRLELHQSHRPTERKEGLHLRPGPGQPARQRNRKVHGGLMTCPQCKGAHSLAQCPRWRVRGVASVSALVAGVAIGVAVAAGAAAWLAVSRAQARVDEVTRERDQARTERDAANRSLLVLTEAGTEARKRGTKALADASRALASAEAQIARVRTDVAGGQAMACDEAAEWVRQELLK